MRRAIVEVTPSVSSYGSLEVFHVLRFQLSKSHSPSNHSLRTPNVKIKHLVKGGEGVVEINKNIVYYPLLFQGLIASL